MRSRQKVDGHGGAFLKGHEGAEAQGLALLAVAHARATQAKGEDVGHEMGIVIVGRSGPVAALGDGAGAAVAGMERAR